MIHKVKKNTFEGFLLLKFCKMSDLAVVIYCVINIFNQI